MTDLQSEFGDFVPTGRDSFDANVPTGNEFSDRYNWWGSDVKRADPKKDTPSQYRIIPWPGVNYFAVTVKLHEGVGAEKHSFPCLSMLGPDVACPFCRAAREAYGEGNKDLGGYYLGRDRYLLWIIDRMQPNLGPLLWRIPMQTMTTIRNLMLSPTTGHVLAIDHLDQGHDIIFTRRKETQASGFYTINDIRFDTQPTPLGTREQVTQWLAHVRNHANLADVLNFQAEEDLAKLIGDGTGFDPFQEKSGPARNTVAATANPADLQQALSVQQQNDVAAQALNTPPPSAGVVQPVPSLADQANQPVPAPPNPQPAAPAPVAPAPGVAETPASTPAPAVTETTPAPAAPTPTPPASGTLDVAALRAKITKKS